MFIVFIYFLLFFLIYVFFSSTDMISIRRTRMNIIFLACVLLFGISLYVILGARNALKTIHAANNGTWFYLVIASHPKEYLRKVLQISLSVLQSRPLNGMHFSSILKQSN